MTQTLLSILADFDTQLADSVAIGDTTATLASATDDDGVGLPAGIYGFTIDAGNSSKEYIIATVSSTALTSISSINRQGVTTSGFVRGHRRGAKVTVTDWAILSRMLKNLNGTTGFNSLVKLGYDADPGITSSDLTKFATVQFVIDTAIAGAPDATESTKGITKLSVAAASASDPIAVGDNDPRVPTTGENDALAGTSGTPSSSNKYVTNDDTATAATADKVARRLATGDVTVPTTPTATTDAASKAYVDAGYAMTLPLGESFTGATTPQPALIINDLWQPLINKGIRMGVSTGEDATGGEQVACKFTPRESVTSSTVLATIFKVNAPTDNILIEIQTDNAGSPSGTAVTNGTSNGVAGTGLSATDTTYQTFTFASAFTLSADTAYWVVFKRSSTLSNTDYYGIASYDPSSDYASFVGKYYDGAAWSSSQLPAFEIVPASGNGSMSLWQSDANASAQIMQQFRGFCTTTGSAGDNGTIITDGVVTGFSSLVPLNQYKVSTTKGTIGLSDSGQVVGTAISATQIKLKSRKVCPPITMCAVNSTFGINGTKNYSIKMPFDSTIVANLSGNPATYTLTVTDVAATFSYASNLGAGLTGAVTVPLRAGQFIKQAIGTGAVTAYVIPEY